MTYQGWKNWETWNLALWVSNTEPLYREMRSLRPFTPLKAKQLALRMYPDGTPDMRSVASRPRGFIRYMDSIDWQEIADDWNED
jgi:hypothetical protein